MGGHADAEAFSTELAALKRDGCNVLVVSDAAGRDAACQRLLGAPELDRRHVFLETASGVSEVLDRHSPRRTDASTLAVVDATPATGARSAAAAAPASDDLPTPLGEWYERVDDPTDFAALTAAVTDALDRVAAPADNPSELRLCVDGLDPFFDAVRAGDVTEERLFRFLHLLTSSVRDADGMGHFHVAASADDAFLATVEPLFDATLSVETGADGTVRQRWRLHDSGRVTDWFAF
ncbi:uncharacterized protein HHUB_1481 [Halobacterium hubeiense]|uniref:Uncharacterized protein n=1 Tax=Halobacterium hubeiense TaxID=1407499 RepID=A0A0U5H1Q0_9EURY|nr:hypothetical protein [Halobacterium hubeiense]CQH49026.1 uncharacterized protein HHUB_1481 [Halobacterium hubeiense]